MRYAAVISDGEFEKFRAFLYERAGIALSPAKRALVVGRLGKRVRHLGLRSFAEYHSVVTSGHHPQELQTAIDLLTTNETYFFRESRHFEFLRQALAAHRGERPYRVWSAACSYGQEAYSIAMTLHAALGTRAWQVVATDISSRAIQAARRGRYPIAEAGSIPEAYLRDYCLKGVRAEEGSLLVERFLRERVDFRQLNVHDPWPDWERFDAIFVRNVMIYFDADTKRRLVRRLCERLRPGGYLITGHSETLNGLTDRVRAVSPSIYRLSADPE